METTYPKWSDCVSDRKIHLPPSAVFFIKEGDKEEAWRKLFRFMSRVMTLDVDELDLSNRVKWYPLQWRYLRKLSWNLLYTHRLIAFKIRQILATWTLAALYTWEAMAYKNSLSIYASKGRDESRDFLGNRIRWIYSHLPKHWQRSVKLLRPRADSLKWDNGSRVLSSASTAVSGRTYTFNRAVIDEAGIIQHCVHLRDSLEPTLGAIGKMALVSTPYEIESDFEQCVTDAEEGKDEYEIIKFPLGRIEMDRGERYGRTIKRKIANLSERGRKTEYGLEFARKEELALFPTFDPKIHIMPQSELESRYRERDPEFSLTIQTGRERACPVYCAIDPHNSKPTAVLWMAVLPDGTWYVLDELWDRDHIEKTVQVALARERKWRIVNRVVDPFANTNYRTLGSPTLAQKMRDCGMAAIRTAKRARAGLNDIQAKLEVGMNGMPGLRISPNCRRLIKQMKVAGSKNDQTAQKGGKYHFVDCLKYIANSRPLYDVRQWQDENLEKDTRYDALLRQFHDNVVASQRGAGRQWTKTRLN